MTEPVTHRASIRWSAEQHAQGLPTFTRTIDPSWLFNETPKQDEGWSLLCDFATPPALQGSPSIARVRYLLPDAPHHLVQGLRLQLFERGTGQLAVVDILD